jgi:LysM repeat protein
MKKSSWLVILIVLALALSLPACQRSASKVPTATAANVPFPTPLPGNALQNVLSGTQTAQAALTKPAATSAPVATKTAAENAPTATPAPAIPIVPAASATAEAVVAATEAPAATTSFKTVKPEKYTLQKGEFPFCIARRFNVNVRDLLSLNGLSMSSKPAVGTTLKIPTSGSWADGSRSLISHPATYTVKSGDTIYSIGCAYGDVDPDAIIAANNLKSPYSLSAGKTLSIP